MLQAASFAGCGRWKTARVGRKGDGYNLRAVAGGDGRQHLIFKPLRFSADPSPLIAMDVPDDRPRELVDPSFGTRNCSIALTPDGSPAVLYHRQGRDGRGEYALARREATGWARKIAFDWAPDAISNLVCDRRGKLQVAYADRDSRRVMLATCMGDAWRAGPVREYVQAGDPPDDAPPLLHLVLRLDARDRPVVVISRSSARPGQIRAFRPND